MDSSKCRHTRAIAAYTLHTWYLPPVKCIHKPHFSLACLKLRRSSWDALLSLVHNIFIANSDAKPDKLCLYSVCMYVPCMYVCMYVCTCMYMYAVSLCLPQGIPAPKTEWALCWLQQTDKPATWSGTADCTHHSGPEVRSHVESWLIMYTYVHLHVHVVWSQSCICFTKQHSLYIRIYHGTRLYYTYLL